MQLNWFNHIQPNPFSFTGILTGVELALANPNAALLVAASSYNHDVNPPYPPYYQKQDIQSLLCISVM